MKFATTVVASACLLGSTFALAPSVHAHATYNLSGYGSGLPGSTNGADGSPTTEPPAIWTNGGVSEYTGSLPVNWYAGMHNRTQIRTLQTGTAPAPSNSLLNQVESYNAAVPEPDRLPTDRVLAVGGKSWSDPENDGQGWGHGLDYGLIHYSPVETILADGPVNFTVTLADDSSDAASVRLAFAIYGGWDTGSSSVRHQTFVTSPNPVNNPLGSTGLTLIDYAVAAEPGQTVARTYALTEAYGGEYTVFVAALGGVAGQYQLTVATAPAPAGSDLAQCLADLEETTAVLAAETADADVDGQRDQDDVCPTTPAGQVVDQAGCSQAEFCATFDAATKAGAKACKKADWKNDEPLLKNKADRDCTVDKGAKGSADDRCVPAS